MDAECVCVCVRGNFIGHSVLLSSPVVMAGRGSGPNKERLLRFLWEGGWAHSQNRNEELRHPRRCWVRAAAPPRWEDGVEAEARAPGCRTCFKSTLRQTQEKLFPVCPESPLFPTGGRASLLGWVDVCPFSSTHAHGVSSLSPSPRLLLQNCRFSVNRDSSDMH